jgi:hypothetical protein
MSLISALINVGGARPHLPESSPTALIPPSSFARAFVMLVPVSFRCRPFSRWRPSRDFKDGKNFLTPVSGAAMPASRYCRDPARLG